MGWRVLKYRRIGGRRTPSSRSRSRSRRLTTGVRLGCVLANTSGARRSAGAQQAMACLGNRHSIGAQDLSHRCRADLPDHRVWSTPPAPHSQRQVRLRRKLLAEQAKRSVSWRRVSKGQQQPASRQPASAWPTDRQTADVVRRTTSKTPRSRAI